MDIALDFDGTCTSHEFPAIGKDIGSVAVLRKIVASGHNLILFTMRSDRPLVNDAPDPEINNNAGLFLKEAIDWFLNNEIPLHGIQKNPTQDAWTTSPKCYAHYYIDDAAIGCPLKYDATISQKPFVDWVAIEKLLVDKGIIIL